MARVHGNALKQGLTKEEVAYAWENPIRCRQRNGTDDPPLWISVGSLPDGRFAELIGFMDMDGAWCVFHAFSVTLSVKIPTPMKRVIDSEARSEGKTTSAYVRGVLADSLMAIA